MLCARRTPTPYHSGVPSLPPPAYVITPTRQALIARGQDGQPVAAWVELRDESEHIGRALHACDERTLADALIHLRTPIFTSVARVHELSLPGQSDVLASIDRTPRPMTASEHWIVRDAEDEPVATLDEQAPVGAFIRATFSYLGAITSPHTPRVFLLDDPQGPLAAFHKRPDRLEVRLAREPEPPVDDLLVLTLACLLAELAE